MAEETFDDWVTVHCVHDFCDCPRSGVADYRGAPHAFQCEWDDAADDWSKVFLLSPITDGQLSIVQESWSIWLRFLERFHTGSLQPGDEHPALAEDWPRHNQLHASAEAALKVDEAIAVRATAEFRGSLAPTQYFEARWHACGE